MTFWVDNSILESTAKCSTQALMQYHFGWRTKDGMHIANTGKAIHKAHENWFKNWDVGAAITDFEAAYDKWVGPEAAELDPKDACQKENVKEILNQYYLTHPKEFFPFEPITGGIEQLHHAPLVDDIEFFGLIDLPVREKQTGALYVCDHKNRFGYINEWWTKKFGLTSQFSGYIWLLQKIYNEMVPGIYLNAIAVKKLPDPTTTRCRTHKVSMSQCRLQHVEATLFISTRTPLAIDNWYRQACILAKRYKALTEAFTSVDMVQYAADEGRFNGSCTFCDFRKWCRADRGPKMVETMFVNDPWKPWLLEGDN